MTHTPFHYFGTGLLTTTGTIPGTMTSAGGNSVLVKAGSGYVLDKTDPQFLGGAQIPQLVQWDDITQDITSLFPGTDGNFPIAIDKDGNLVMFDNGGRSTLTADQYNKYIGLGAISVSSNVITLVAEGIFPSFLVQQNIYALATAIGVINSSSNPFSISPSVAVPNSLRLQVSAGEAVSVAAGIGFGNETPLLVQQASALDPTALVALVLRDGSFSFSPTAEVDPTQYEDPVGTLNTMSGNKYTLQRIFLFPGGRIPGILYGDAEYTSLAAAEAAASEPVPNVPLFATAFHIANLAIKHTAIDFNDPTEFTFLGV